MKKFKEPPVPDNEYWTVNYNGNEVEIEVSMEFYDFDETNGEYVSSCFLVAPDHSSSLACALDFGGLHHESDNDEKFMNLDAHILQEIEDWATENGY